MSEVGFVATVPWRASTSKRHQARSHRQGPRRWAPERLASTTQPGNIRNSWANADVTWRSNSTFLETSLNLTFLESSLSLNLGCTVSVQMFSSLAIWWLPAVSLQELQLPTRNAHPQQSSSFLAGHALEENVPWLFLTGYNRIPAMRATVSDNSLYGAAALAANPCSRISEISPHVGCWTNV